MVEFSFRLEDDDGLAAMKVLGGSSKLKWAGYLFAFMAIYSLVTIAVRGNTEGVASAVFYLVAGIGLVFLPRFQSRKLFQNMRESDRFFSYRFTNDGLVVESGHGRTEAPWSTIHRTVENERVLALILANNTGYVLPKRAMTSQQIEELRTLVRTHVVEHKPSKAFYKNVFVLWLVLLLVFYVIWTVSNR